MPLFVFGINFRPITDSTGGFSSEGIGIWIAALLTLGIYSFLYKDNFIYKFSEYLFVGISAGYTLVLTFHRYLYPSLIEPLQNMARDSYHIMTGAGATITDPWMLKWQNELISNHFGSQFQFIFMLSLKIAFLYLVPAMLGLMMIARLFPNSGWLSKYPLATIVGYGSGIVIVTTLQASVLEQIKASFVSFAPIFAATPLDAATVNELIKNFVMVFGLCCSLIYFYFSAEHKGPIFGTASRIGIVVLMITFGSAFGYTVMARISLLISRFQFLLGDWMQVIK